MGVVNHFMINVFRSSQVPANGPEHDTLACRIKTTEEVAMTVPTPATQATPPKPSKKDQHTRSSIAGFFGSALEYYDMYI